MPPPTNLTVLGGGVSGLSLAYFLRQRLQQLLVSPSSPLTTLPHITVVEAQPRLGGWVQSNPSSPLPSPSPSPSSPSSPTPHPPRHVFERGPRGFRPNGNGVEILRLAEALSLSQDAVKTSDASKHRFLYVDGQLQQMPASPTDVVLRMPSVLKEAFRGIVHEPFVPRGLWSDETVHSFVSRRFGDHVATRVFGGMVSGIYAGDIHRLSMKSCFPKLWNWERDHGSVLKGMFSKNSPNQDPFQGVVAEDSPFVQSYATAAQVSFKHGGWTWKGWHGAGRCCFTVSLLFVFVCARGSLGADVLDTLTVLCLLCLLCLLFCCWVVSVVSVVVCKQGWNN